MVIKPIVPTALDLLALVHWNLHHVQILNIFFAAVPKRRRLDSTRLTQGPTLHHLTRGSFREARGSTYFQCNVPKYAHVLGLKLPKIRQLRAWFWVSSRTGYTFQNLAPEQKDNLPTRVLCFTSTIAIYMSGSPTFVVFMLPIPQWL